MSLRSTLLALMLLLIPLASAQAVNSLHDALPADAIAYLRLAGDGNFVGPAPGTPLYDAVMREPLAKRSHHMMAAVSGQLAGDPKLRTAAPWLSLLARLRAPIEMVALAPPGRPVAMANLLLRSGVAVDSVDALNEMIAEWAAQNPALTLITPMPTGGVGLVQYAGSVPVLYSFDVAAGVLYVMSGMAADAPSLQQAVASLQPSSGHRMYAIEAQIDSSQQGPFLWLDPSRIGPAMMAGGDPQAGGAMVMGMAGAVRSLALGWGVRDGKGRLALVADVPRQGGMGQMVPPIDNAFELTSRGQPWLFGSINIPARQMLLTFEGFLQMDPEAMADYQINKSMFAAEFGLTYEQLAGLLGPEWLVFGDDVGEYGAIRVRDQANLDTLLAKIGSTDGNDYSQIAINGVSYHHLAITVPGIPDVSPGDDAAAEDADKQAIIAAFMRLQSKARKHIYWVRDGEYLVFSQVPQALMDRAAATDKVVLGNWLVEQQGQHADHALFALSTRIDDVPRRTYYGWLKALEWVGDVIGQPLDLFSQPSATRLKLPDSGAFGLQLDVSDPYLSLEMNFEASPLEFLLGKTGAFTVGAVVITAAIASALNDFDEAQQCDADDGLTK